MGEFVGTDAAHGKVKVGIVADEISGEPAPIDEKNPQLARPVHDVTLGREAAIG